MTLRRALGLLGTASVCCVLLYCKTQFHDALQLSRLAPRPDVDSAVARAVRASVASERPTAGVDRMSDEAAGATVERRNSTEVAPPPPAVQLWAATGARPMSATGGLRAPVAAEVDGRALTTSRTSSIASSPALTLDPGTRFVCGSFGIGRLGNHLFQYASVLGVALRHNLTVAYCLENWQLQSYRKLGSLFRVSAFADRCSFAASGALIEKGWGLYNPDVDDPKRFGQRTFVRTFLQSYKYFDAYRERVAREFELTPPYAAQADGFLRRAAGGRANVTFVGVHVRRGDMVAGSPYNVAPESFIARAMDAFRDKYGGGGSTSSLVFVVASDDLAWVSASLLRLNRTLDVVYASTSAEGDLAVLSRCNHSVVTSGSFGWWAAWLAGGGVIYYRNFIPNTSKLAAGYALEDYYPPSWIGFD